MCEWLDTAEHAQSVCVCVCVPINLAQCTQGRRSHRSWGSWPHFLRQRGTGGKVNVENTKITTGNISISVTQSATNQTKELGWLSYLSNILSTHWPKSGGSKIFSLLAQLTKLSPHFQNCGAAHECTSGSMSDKPSSSSSSSAAAAAAAASIQSSLLLTYNDHYVREQTNDLIDVHRVMSCHVTQSVSNRRLQQTAIITCKHAQQHTAFSNWHSIIHNSSNVIMSYTSLITRPYSVIQL